MFKIEVDDENAIVAFVLVGFFCNEEIREFADALLDATRSLAGREIKIKGDLRAFKPAKPGVENWIRFVQEEGLRLGVMRVAEVVENYLVAMQLNSVAHQSGTEPILRRFWEDEAAMYWLVHGDDVD